jgi:hypothetical protein
MQSSQTIDKKPSPAQIMTGFAAGATNILEESHCTVGF